jgi:hypothetical protein
LEEERGKSEEEEEEKKIRKRDPNHLVGASL